MTSQEAKDLVALCGLNVRGNKESECISVIVSALEKQIPKKPIDDRFPWRVCPNCEGSVYVKHIQEHIGNEETTYCEHCGQALDWGLE